MNFPNRPPVPDHSTLTEIPADLAGKYHDHDAAGCVRPRSECNWLRRIADSPCSYCGRPLGYGVPIGPTGARMSHSTCIALFPETNAAHNAYAKDHQ